MNDGVLRKEMQELENSEKDFHQRFELTIPEKKYESWFIRRHCLCLENVIDDNNGVLVKIENNKCHQLLQRV